MSRTASPSGAKPYGLARVCRVWQVARATVKSGASGAPLRGCGT